MIEESNVTNKPLTNNALITLCYEMAQKSYDEGGLPIGSVLARGDEIISTGHNQRVQNGDPIAHGEMDCLRNAGRQKSYRDLTLYTSLSPCMMCSGTIVQFKIKRLVILDDQNFGGNEDFLREHGISVEIVNDSRCLELMSRFIREKPELWHEDIAE
jgi:cytosine/creatinine deaminase